MMDLFVNLVPHQSFGIKLQKYVKTAVMELYLTQPAIDAKHVQ